MSFPRYPAYRDSGVAWVGEIPEHWESVLARRLFASRREPAQNGDEQLTASQKYGVIPQKLFMDLEEQKVALALSGTESFRHVEANDFVISLRSFQGGIEHSRYSGCVSPAYTVLQPVEAVGPQYFSYLLKCAPFVAALQSMTDGLRDGKAISYGQFASLCLPLPSRTEQTAIAAFLDRETAKIDALVAEQRRLMDLLREQRQAVISHAVIKGLNPDAPIKDSGVEWLGEVPAHWGVLPLRWFAECSSGDGIAPLDVEGDTDEGHRVPVIGGNGVMGYCAEENVSRTMIAVGRVGALCGNVHVVDPPAWVTDNALMLQPSTVFLTPYLAHVLRARRLNDLASKTAQPLITGTQLMDQRVPCPPALEQNEILDRVSQREAYFADLIAVSEQSTRLLLERRAALITAAVTGQIDVRGMAAEAA